MIPDRVVEVVTGPSVLWIGTRDGELRPNHAYVTGAIVHEDRETITFFVTEKRARVILANVENNGRVALAAGQASHEAYQLKGAYLTSRPATDDDYALQEAYRDKTWRALAQFWPEELVKPQFTGAVYRPSIAITFRVEEVFLQTPGPGAGSKLA
jgi:hypothetical protein